MCYRHGWCFCFHLPHGWICEGFGFSALYTCPNCGRMVRSDFKVCPHCGTQLKKSCESCGAELDPSWRYCPKCGKGVGQ